MRVRGTLVMDPAAQKQKLLGVLVHMPAAIIGGSLASFLIMRGDGTSLMPGRCFYDPQTSELPK